MVRISWFSFKFSIFSFSLIQTKTLLAFLTYFKASEQSKQAFRVAYCLIILFPIILFGCFLSVCCFHHSNLHILCIVCIHLCAVYCYQRSDSTHFLKDTEKKRKYSSRLAFVGMPHGCSILTLIQFYCCFGYFAAKVLTNSWYSGVC